MTAQYAIQTKNLTLRYGKKVAVDGVNLDLPAGKIYGLLGRNGSGKTSLLSVLAGYYRPSGGSVRSFGRDPFRSQQSVARSCFIRDQLDVQESSQAREVIEIQAALRPSFDLSYAAELADLFELDLQQRPQAMSRGQRSALGIVLGLASRADMNYFDEVYLGLDAPSRYKFYEQLLVEYERYPRTFILSSHYIDELERVLEDVIIMDGAKILAHASVEDLKMRAVSVIGPHELVRSATAGTQVIGSQRLGGTTQVTLYGDFGSQARAEFEQLGLEVATPSLQDIFVYLTESTRSAA